MIDYELERYDLAVRILEPAVAMAPDSPGAVRALEVRPGPPLIYGQGQYNSLTPT